jgi:hypothetical protein
MRYLPSGLFTALKVCTQGSNLVPIALRFSVDAFDVSHAAVRGVFFV